jgi:hypothetical protein
MLVDKSLSRLVARCNDTVIYAVEHDVTRISALRPWRRIKIETSDSTRLQLGIQSCRGCTAATICMHQVR